MAQYSSADQLTQRQYRSTDPAELYPPRLMASQQSLGDQIISPHLSQNQQDLLLAALNSQAGSRQSTFPLANSNHNTQATPINSASQPSNMNSFNEDGLFISPQQATLDDFQDNYSPDLDYLDDEGFDFENTDLGGEMIGTLPGDSFNGNDLHEKRKNSEEFSGEEEGDAKRQETQEGEKSAKKPGRKPLTSEPTTVSMIR